MSASRRHYWLPYPKTGLVIAAFGGGGLKRLVTSFCTSLSISKIDKGIVAVAFFHVQKIQHPDFIALAFPEARRYP